MSTAEPVFFLGDDALGVTLSSKHRRNALAQYLQDSRQWREVIPGANGLSVQYDPAFIAPEDALAALEKALAAEIIPTNNAHETLVIPVCYHEDFALDMPHVSASIGLSSEEIIARHTAARHHVDVIGFTPGFAYLEGGDEALNVPRLNTPRTYLSAGSIGLAGGLCGLYALPGPGGWPIIGRSPMPLFDTAQKDPFRIQAGQSIQFTAISKADFEDWR